MTTTSTSRSVNDLLILGSATGERGRAFSASLARAGLPPAQFLSYRSFLTGTPDPPPPGCVVRLESPSDDPDLDWELARLGGGRVGEQTELLPGEPWYSGLTELLRRVDDWLTAGGLDSGQRMQHVPSVLAMIDKAETHRRLLAAGVPVAPGFTPAAGSSWESIRTAAETRGWGQTMIKARYGSSAAGLIAVRWLGERVAGWTTVELAGGRAYNTRRLVRLHSHAEVAAVVRAIRWIHVERWLPKLSFAEGAVDLRVVVIGGRAQHVLARVARGPFTNLHLGAQRGDVEALRAQLGNATWAALLAAAEQAAGCFPDALYAGFDLGPVGAECRPAVWEVNAFGDFHEGIEVESRDTYQAELLALASHHAKKLNCRSENQPEIRQFSPSTIQFLRSTTPTRGTEQ